MAVKKLRFLWDNWFDAATVTASSSAADYPVEMLQNRWKAAECGWRSTGLAAEWVIADLGSARAVQAFVLENMNLTAGATVELGGHASDPTALGAGDTTYHLHITVTAAMVTAKRIVVNLAAAETYQWWRLLVTDAGNGDGYLAASRIYLGPYFEPTRTYRTQWKHQPESDTKADYSSGGQASVQVRPDYETYDVPIGIAGQADATAYAAINTTCGKKKPLWICMDSTDLPTYTVYGHFLEYIPFPSVIDGRAWESSLRFREEL